MAQLPTFTIAATVSLDKPPTHCFVDHKGGPFLTVWTLPYVCFACNPGKRNLTHPPCLSLMTPSALISLVCSKHPCIFSMLCSLGKTKSNKLVCGPSLIKQGRFVCCNCFFRHCFNFPGCCLNTALKKTAFIHHIKKKNFFFFLNKRQEKKQQPQ